MLDVLGQLDHVPIAPSASPTSARPSSRGADAPASPCTGRSCGRTGARPTAATSSPRDGVLPMVRERTGLVLDPYFSGTKFEWLLATGACPIDADLALGTIDSWLLWNLTGGEVHATDPSQREPHDAVRHPQPLLWMRDLCSLLHVPIGALPAVLPIAAVASVSPATAAVCHRASRSRASPATSRAALFGQACFTAGMAKNTYGTGSFILLNVGSRPALRRRRACSPRWRGPWRTAPSRTRWKGPIFVTGAAVQWLRDGLADHLGSSRDRPARRDSCRHTAGVYIVPAFAGLGSPWWDPYARGTIVGITRGTDGPTSPAPWWRRWRTRPATPSTQCRPRPARRSPTCASTAAPRRWT